MSEKKAEEAISDEVSQIAGNGEQSLDQIREILFGSQSRDIDSRFDDLSQHFTESLEGLRGLIREQFDALTQRLDHEVQALRDDLQKSQIENRNHSAQLETKQQAATSSLREQIESLKAALASAERSLRGEAEEGLLNLREQLMHESESLRSQLQQSVDQVAKASVTRQALGEALREVSGRFDEG